VHRHLQIRRLERLSLKQRLLDRLDPGLWLRAFCSSHTISIAEWICATGDDKLHAKMSISSFQGDW
jgi:hypothetical protein